MRQRRRPACPAVGSRGPCNRETHCEGQIAAEVGWDLQFRDLRAAPFNFDANTALELTTRLSYLGSQTLTSWYTCARCAPRHLRLRGHRRLPAGAWPPTTTTAALPTARPT